MAIRIPTGSSVAEGVDVTDDHRAPLPTYMEETFRLLARLRCPACGNAADVESFSLSRDDVACTTAATASC